MKLRTNSAGVRCVSLLAALLSTHCGSSSSDAGKGGNSSTGGGSAGGATGSGGEQSSGGAVMSIPGAPGCGLGSLAAFCDSFDMPTTNSGRGGDLDPAKWSAARNQPQFPSANGLSIGISAATIPKCRSGVSDHVFPDGDTLICDPETALASNHLLVATAAQNYGQNSYRIRQPFDFAGRTGKIVFDAEGYNSALLGWVSVEVTEDPIPGPSFDTPGVGNDEGSVLPKNAFEVQFQNTCDGYVTVPSVGLRMLIVYDNYVGTFLKPMDKPVCPTTKQGNVNHFEVTVSKTKIEVFGTDYSPDGATFGTPQLMFSASVNLPFSRGYVNITTHNHATKKYSVNNALDSWVARWDNVGFDGPVIPSAREYDAPDSLVMGMATGSTVPVTNIGYRVADVADGPNPALHFAGVDPSGAKSARLALSAYYLVSDKTAQYVLRFRLNGGTWHDRPLSASESGIINGMSQGQIAEMIDVPLTDLVAGDNTLEFVTVNVPQNYPPVVSNISLILDQ